MGSCAGRTCHRFDRKFVFVLCDYKNHSPFLIRCISVTNSHVWRPRGCHRSAACYKWREVQRCHTCCPHFWSRPVHISNYFWKVLSSGMWRSHIWYTKIDVLEKTFVWCSWVRASWYNYDNNQQDALYRLTLILLTWRIWWANNVSRW